MFCPKLDDPKLSVDIMKKLPKMPTMNKLTMKEIMNSIIH